MMHGPINIRFYSRSLRIPTSITETKSIPKEPPPPPKKKLYSISLVEGGHLDPGSGEALSTSLHRSVLNLDTRPVRVVRCPRRPLKPRKRSPCTYKREGWMGPRQVRTNCVAQHSGPWEEKEPPVFRTSRRLSSLDQLRPIRHQTQRNKAALMNHNVLLHKCSSLTIVLQRMLVQWSSF